MKVRPLSEILEEYPDFKPDWKPKDGGICNPDRGYNRHVVICDDEGNPLWDQQEFSENPGSIIVPYFSTDKGEFYFNIVKQKRPVVKDLKTGEQGNMISFEFPMGFALKGESLEDAAARELSEETNSVVKNWESLGYNYINPLPALYVDIDSNAVFAAEVYEDKIKSIDVENLSKEAVKEGILSSDYVSVTEVADLIKSGKMFCGLSQAAFGKFVAYKGF